MLLQLLGGGEYGDDRDDSSDLKYGGGGSGSRDDSFGPGDLDGRATMVPPTGISTMRVSNASMLSDTFNFTWQHFFMASF